MHVDHASSNGNAHGSNSNNSSSISSSGMVANGAGSDSSRREGGAAGAVDSTPTTRHLQERIPSDQQLRQALLQQQQFYSSSSSSGTNNSQTSRLGYSPSSSTPGAGPSATANASRGIEASAAQASAYARDPPTPASSANHEPVNGANQCAVCHTSDTPLWRREVNGKAVCNACGERKTAWLRTAQAQRVLLI